MNTRDQQREYIAVIRARAEWAKREQITNPEGFNARALLSVLERAERLEDLIESLGAADPADTL